jgi:hypothetical protein
MLSHLRPQIYSRILYKYVHENIKQYTVFDVYLGLQVYLKHYKNMCNYIAYELYCTKCLGLSYLL